MTPASTASARVAAPPNSREPSPEQLQSVRLTLRSPGRLKTEVLAGLVVALALIPEAIAFALIAGVDPQVGLFAAATMAMTIAFVGGRPAMVSAATAATALVVAPLVASHGLDHLIAAVILAGGLQVVLGLLGVAKLMRFVPRSVMVGFVNALAILIFTSQLPDLMGVPWLVYPLTALGLAIILLLPRVTTAVPAPLVAIVVVTVIVLLAGADVPTVGDKGRLPDSLPALLVPDVPFTLETLQLLFPYALGMAVVGLLESLMTAKLVDDITDTHSSKTRESWGQGVANVVSGLFGGMGGCAMVGQTMINVKASGARSYPEMRRRGGKRWPARDFRVRGGSCASEQWRHCATSGREGRGAGGERYAPATFLSRGPPSPTGPPASAAIMRIALGCNGIGPLPGEVSMASTGPN